MRSTIQQKLWPMSVSSPQEFLSWFEDIHGTTSVTKYTKAGYIYERVVLTSYGDIALLTRLGEAGLDGVGAAVIKTQATLTGSFIVPPLVLTCRSRERRDGGKGLSSCLVWSLPRHRSHRPHASQVFVEMSTATVQPGGKLHMAPGLDDVTDPESPFSGLMNVRASFASAMPHFFERAATISKDAGETWKRGLTTIARELYVLNALAGGRGLRVAQSSLIDAVGESGTVQVLLLLRASIDSPAGLRRLSLESGPAIKGRCFSTVAQGGATPL
jgi:hypothetical protein